MTLRMLVILLALAALAACGAGAPALGPAQPAGPTQPGPFSEPATIEMVEVELRESDPVQVVAHIEGYMANGCYSLGEISQRRDGNQIEVTVLADHSGAEVCTMQLQPIDERVLLEGDFAPGEYTLRVNEVETRFRVG
jgi:hypothetical protein